VCRANRHDSFFRAQSVMFSACMRPVLLVSYTMAQIHRKLSSRFTQIALTTCFLATPAFSAPVRDGSPPPINILRYEGKLYESYSVKSISPAGAVINHSKGTLIIPLEKLPPTISTPHKQEVRKAIEDKLAKDKERQFREATEAEVRNTERAAKAKSESELKAKQEKYPGYEVFQIRVVQVLANGLLGDRMEQRQFHSPPITSSLGSVGGGGGTFGGGVTSVSVSSGKVIFIEGSFQGAYDQQILWVAGYPSNVHSYRDVLGAQRTVQKWILVP
jgi:hypothetical protein